VGVRVGIDTRDPDPFIAYFQNFLFQRRYVYSLYILLLPQKGCDAKRFLTVSYAFIYPGSPFDTGDKPGDIEMIIEYAL
jgi:hypothetical protein